MSDKYILVVDDSDTTRLLIERMIKKLGFKTINAVDGQNALDVLAEKHRDITIVVTDINMPNLDGFGLIRQMREDQKLLNMPIIVISTENSTDKIDLAKSYGACAWIVKPVHLNKLKEMLSQIVNLP